MSQEIQDVLEEAILRIEYLEDLSIAACLVLA